MSCIAEFKRTMHWKSAELTLLSPVKSALGTVVTGAAEALKANEISEMLVNAAHPLMTCFMVHLR